jgi:hypothetical protein
MVIFFRKKNTETKPKLPVFRFVSVQTERKKNPFRRTPYNAGNKNMSGEYGTKYLRSQQKIFPEYAAQCIYAVNKKYRIFQGKKRVQ